MTHPRPDLSGIKGINDFAVSLRPEGLTEQLQQRARAIREVQEKVQELTGRAQSDDGFVVATYTAVDGFSGLTLDPRAMRMPSEDLAAEIVSVSKAAREDYEAQRREVAAELGPSEPVDLEQAERTIAEISDAATRGMGDMQAMFERFRNQMGR